MSTETEKESKIMPTKKDKTCPNCGGSGVINRPVKDPKTGERKTVAETCKACNGKGTR